ncbi:MAG TPA: PAS domain S-box protein [Terriglobales bacterium]|nr:PAS domain S-box protein [Terriglobales bacterium]
MSKSAEISTAGRARFSSIDRGRFNRALIITVALPFVLMAATAATLLWAINDLVNADESVRHAGQVLVRSYEAQKLILDMETSVRGYLNTASDGYLDPYRRAKPAVAPALARLADSLRNDPAGQESVRHIEQSLARWDGFAEMAIQARRIGKAPVAEIDNARGKVLMDHMRDEFALLFSDQEQRRDQALASSGSARRLTSRIALLVTLICGSLVAMFLVLELVLLSRTYERSLTRSDALARELAERERHFRTLAEVMPHMVWSAAPDGSPDYFNQRWREYVGATDGAQESWLSRVDPDDRARAEAQWSASLASGKPLAIELRLRDAQGIPRWYLGRSLPLQDDRGAITRWLGTFTDIDDQKRAQAALVRTATIVESSDDAIYSKDVDGNVTSWNRGAEKMFGYTPQEIIGHSVAVLYPEGHKQEMDETLTLLRSGQSVEHFETVRQRKDGKQIEVSVSISPIRASDGTIAGASTIARDVTERNRATEALRKTEKLAATGRLAGTMAHEINNPLEAVTHLLYLIEKSPSLDASARNYAQLATEEINRVGRIAKQALGFYREAATPVPVNIAALVREVVTLYMAGAQNKNVHLEAQAENEASIPAFPGEMRQVFSNLIVNAVDAVDRGGTVKIRVKHGRDWASCDYGIRVLVADNGPGIPKSVRARIFEPFFTTKGERGTGVGLWVSEGVVQKHGGKIKMKSSTGTAHGTTFSVFLPYAD